MPSSILNTFSDLKQALRSSWIGIIGVSLVVALSAGFLSRSIHGEYGTYSKIFPLSINKSGGTNPIDALRSQFGISDKTDYEKIYNVKELVLSKTISTNVAKSKPANTLYPSISAWLIDSYNRNIPFWKKKIRVVPGDTTEIHFTGADLVRSCCDINTDLKTNYTTISTHNFDAELAQELNVTILRELSNFYIKMVTEKPMTDLSRIKQMRDSLNDELYSVEKSIAGFIDANQMSVKTTTQLPQTKLLRKQKEVEQLYANTATSYLNAKFKLLWESPIFQVLDQAGPPYSFTKPNWKRNALIAFLLSAVVCSLIASRKVLWRVVLNELSGS